MVKSSRRRAKREQYMQNPEVQNCRKVESGKRRHLGGIGLGEQEMLKLLACSHIVNKGYNWLPALDPA